MAGDESSARVGSVRLTLTQGDITAQAVDAIVNAANSSLLGGGGVDGAIHRAGGPEILEACRAIVAEIGHLPPGDAVVTTAGRLPAHWVIHTVGPIWRGGDAGEAAALARAYASSLARAREVGAGTVAFPSISTGAYGYPVDQAAGVALEAIRRELMADPGPLAEVRLVLFDAHTLGAYQRAIQSVSEE